MFANLSDSQIVGIVSQLIEHQVFDEVLEIKWAPQEIKIVYFHII